MARPVIGITCDTNLAADALAQQPVDPDGLRSWKYESPHRYALRVSQAGGVAVLLPYDTAAIGDYLAVCDGFLLTGGDDPDPVAWGEPPHPAAKRMHPQRQAFELALLDALDAAASPVLGVCLGMQMMALHHGGKLQQHLPEVLPADRAALHRRGEHPITLRVPAHPLLHPGPVYSSHHQAVANPGPMQVVAAAEDGVIEAIQRPDPGRLYLGVQWHPELTRDPVLGPELIGSLVRAAAKREVRP